MMRHRGLVALCAVLWACGGDDDDTGPTLEADGVVWSLAADYGFEGSIAVCDLDGDGAREAIVPLTTVDDDGRALSHVQVVDAETGELRFRTPEGLGGYAYPLCLDANGDGTLDFLTSGRTGDVEAISGIDGTLLWSMAASNPGLLQGNTYTPVAESVGGLAFVTAGGGGNPEIGQQDVRGTLLAFTPEGNVRMTWLEPDGEEIYASPAVIRYQDRLLVAVGSGGERRGGHIRLLEYDEAQDRVAEVFAVASSCATGGFVASPSVADIAGDDAPEVVAVDFCGVVHAIALDGTVLWTHQSDVPYASANPVFADLDGDGDLDVVAAFESLNFSFYSETRDDPHSRVTGLDGASGSELWSERMANLILSTPVISDYNGDGAEDVMVLASAEPLEGTPQLRWMDGRDGQRLGGLAIGNTYGTPVLDDLDGDGVLDVLLTHLEPSRETDDPTKPTPELSFIVRLELDGIAFDAERTYSGFRGHPSHTGAR